MNKRRSERKSCLVPVDGREGSVFASAQTFDFSKGGMGFISQRRIPLNKEIAIELDLSQNDDPLIVRGVVRWVRLIKNSTHYRVGLAFQDIIQGSKTRLSTYFRK